MAQSTSVSVIILTAPAKFPERLPLLRRTLICALAQQLDSRVQLLEVLVLDDGSDSTGGSAWPEVAAVLKNAAADAPRVRYIAVPPDSVGRVNMRLKRNLALLLCAGNVAIFFDDDDWRSVESVQAQFDLLSSASVDVCTVQVQYVCELSGSDDADDGGGGGGGDGDGDSDGGGGGGGGGGDGGTTSKAGPHQGVRYFATPDGGGIFSARLGNPGSMMLRRQAWVSNSLLGFPDTSTEDIDLVRLLTASAPVLSCLRPHRCSHALLDAAVLHAQGRQPTFMTVRLLGRHHEWPLLPLQLTPMASPPQCLDKVDARPVRFEPAHQSLPPSQLSPSPPQLSSVRHLWQFKFALPD